MGLFMVFDVESVGLHGEGFAVGYVVIDCDGVEKASGLFACPSHRATGSRTGLEWVKANVPELDKTHGFPEEVRAAFWAVWKRWREAGAVLVADCPWPVEAQFLIACVDDVRPEIDLGFSDGPRDWEGPYPFIDVSSVILSSGGDPLATHERLENERPEHNPLADARQSARLLIDAIRAGQKP